VSVKVVESGGTERSGGVVFVSPGQVNALLPPELASGPATITVMRDGATVQQDQIQVIKAAPALFVQPVNGLSRPLGELLYTDASGAQQRAPLLSTSTDGTPVIGKLRFSQASGAITLVLYGTGLNASNATSAASARVADVAASVVYAGAQGQYAGLDQYNIEVPRSIAGRGEVTLSILVNGVPATPVRLSVE
jgi:uncharacterized protein (TIGR03437 family)